MLKIDYTSRERLEKALLDRIAELQAELESDITDVQTARIRGGILEIRRLIGEITPDPTQDLSDPVSIYSPTGY